MGLEPHTFKYDFHGVRDHKEKELNICNCSNQLIHTASVSLQQEAT